MSTGKEIFADRLAEYYEELKELCLGLYDDEKAFELFIKTLRKGYSGRKKSLRGMDERKLADPAAYDYSKMLGMMLCPEDFPDGLAGVKEKLPYLKDCGAGLLHLTPLNSAAELEDLTGACHRRGMAVCLDFTTDHVNGEHEWASEAIAGGKGALDRFIVYDSWEIPEEYEKTLHEAFPETAQGNYAFIKKSGKVVKTSDRPSVWDLNYKNPAVLCGMTKSLLDLANCGVDVIRLVPIHNIWKDPGNGWQSIQKTHDIIRIMNLACRIVCPGVVLAGDSSMRPEDAGYSFGSPDKPECGMLYDDRLMCTIWNTLATRDVKALRHHIEELDVKPGIGLYLNYLRNSKGIDWTLDYGYLGWFSLTEGPHRKYLNDWFTGKWPGSPAKGELSADPEQPGSLKIHGTAAELCGNEAADLMLHALLLTIRGIPVICGGDEAPLFSEITFLDGIRRNNDLFGPDAKMFAVNAGDDRVLGVGRYLGGKVLLGLFNFSSEHVTAVIDNAEWIDLTKFGPEIIHGTGKTMEYGLEPYGFCWLMS